MPELAPLPVERLRWTCDIEALPFDTTRDLPPYSDLLGQSRAREALQLGIRIRHDRFNLYVLGPAGLGKRAAAVEMLQQEARDKPPPDDWCYVNCFEQEDRPQALSLPAGRGAKFKADMKRLVDDLRTAIPAALQNEEHASRVLEVEQESQQRQNEAFEAIGRKAVERGLRLIRTPGGFALAPVRNGEVLSPEEFEKLPEDEKQRLGKAVEELQQELAETAAQIPQWRQEVHDKLRDLNREGARLAIGFHIDQLRQQYADLPDVVQYIETVEQSIIEHVEEFQVGEAPPALPLPMAARQEPHFGEYEVNLLVDNGSQHGAPVVYEDHPTYHNLIGRIEHQTRMGALVTDFRLIKAGALHVANGGYLVLDAWRLLSQPYAWEGLKRALYAREIKIESLGEMLSVITTVSLQPQPIPLSVKVVLLGDRLLYYMLLQHDPDFAELFKVAADFNEQMDLTPESCQRYAQVIGTIARREAHRPLDRAAVAEVLEHSARVAGDAAKLSLHMRTLTDLLREADYWAQESGAEVINQRHVQQAIDAQIYRADRVRELVYEHIERGTVLIDTSGERVGQINGLSVIDLGTFAFGQPSRITATARLGKGEVVDIEREVKLGGALHTKGVLILSSLLAARYARDKPLSLWASLVFEQSYGMVDGDSASVAELCTLLSAIARIPLRQDLAVTGSVNQHGEVQAIGGVNEKVEGFFDVCRARGLTGTQGVLIPAANVKNLMLRHDVVEAARQGQFRVYAVKTVDEALQLLSGLEAGEPDEHGRYPEGTVNYLVAERLNEFSERARQLALSQKDAVQPQAVPPSDPSPLPPPIVPPNTPGFQGG